MKLNPTNPVVMQMDTNWHKLCATIMHKLGKTEILISGQDVIDLMNSGTPNIVLDARNEQQKGGMTVKLVSNEEAHKLVGDERRQIGGN